jgi:hypothetical protein
MAKPGFSVTEIENIINRFEEINASNGNLIGFSEIKSALIPEDQTIERFRNLIIPILRKRGINITLNGTQFYYTKENEKVSNMETNSNRTKLHHTYVAPLFYRDLLTSVLMNDNPLFQGPPGCGKSITAENIGWELADTVFKRPDYKVTRLSLGGYFNPADLIGEMLLLDSPHGKGVVTNYIYGHLTEAAEKGYMLICDEVDCMSPEANSAFQRITETDGRIVIKTEKGSVEIKKHPQYRLIFTSNTHLTGDPSGMFGGAQVQNAAFRDRIQTTFEFDYMPSYEVQILLKDYKMPPKVCEMLYGTISGGIAPDKGLVNVLRAACKDGTIQAHLSMRTIMEFARHYKSYNGSDINKSHSWHKSMYYCFISKFPPQYRKQILEIIQTVCGSELVPTTDKKEIERHTDYLKKNGFFPLADTYLPEELKGVHGY